VRDRRHHPSLSGSLNRPSARTELRVLVIGLVLSGICGVQLSRLTGWITCPLTSTARSNSLQTKPLFEKSGIEWAPPVAHFSPLPAIPVVQFTPVTQELRLAVSISEQMYDRPPPIS